jgi:hypothetical protein
MEGLLLTRAEVGRKAASAYVHSMVLDDLLSEDSDGVSLIDDVDDFLDTTGALAKGLYDFGVVLGTTASQGDAVHHQGLVDAAFVPGQGSLYVLMAGDAGGDGGDDATTGGLQRSSDVVVDAIAASIGNLTNKDVRPLIASYRSYESVEAMQRAMRHASVDRREDVVADRGGRGPVTQRPPAMVLGGGYSFSYSYSYCPRARARARALTVFPVGGSRTLLVLTPTPTTHSLALRAIVPPQALTGRTPARPTVGA